SVFDPAWRVAASLHGLERRVAETWPFRGGARRAGGWGADTSTSSKSEWVASFSPRLIGARWRPKLAASSELGREIAVDLEADTDLDEGWGRPSHDQFLSMRRRPPTKLQSLKHLHDGLISAPCRSPFSFISLSRSRPNLFGPTTGDEGDHHAANEIIGACGFERVFALDPAPRAWRVVAARRVLARNRRRERPKGIQAGHG